jgi:hypothetical protein
MSWLVRTFHVYQKTYIRVLVEKLVPSDEEMEIQDADRKSTKIIGVIGKITCACNKPIV